MAGNTHAWDDLWKALADAGVRPNYGAGHDAPWLPISDIGLRYGDQCKETVTRLQATRLTANQIAEIANLVRGVARAARCG